MGAPVVSPQRPANAGGPRTVTVDADTAGQRIDNFLMRELKGVPRTRVYRLLRRGEVRINGGRVKPVRRLAAGDRVRIPPVRDVQYAGGNLPDHLLERLRTSVLHEDADCLVIDKPAGLAVHAGSGLGGGAIDGLRRLWPEAGRLELVHRIDRDTSGCLLVAKGRKPLARLQQALREGGFRKVYEAVLAGDWPGPEAVVDAPLRRDQLQGGERMVRVDPRGKSARSVFRRLAGSGAATLAEVEIETGRTHQIRVHAARLGYPVVGDPKYGDPQQDRRALGASAPRLFLHARRLDFPGAEGRVTVDSARPAAFDDAIDGEGSS